MRTRKLKLILSGYLRYFIIALIATGLGTFFNLMNPQIIRLTIDSAIDKLPLDTTWYLEFIVNKLGGVETLRNNLWICGLGILLVAVTSGLFLFIRGRLTAHGAESMANRLKDRLYNQLQKLPYNYHVQAKTGDLIQRCTSDVDTIRRFFAGQIVELGRTLFMIAIAVPTMFALNLKLSIASMFIFPIIFAMSYVFFKNIKKTFLKADEKEGELSTVLQENLSGVRVVRAFGRQRFEMDKFQTKNVEFRDLGMKIINLMAMYWSFSDLLAIVQLAIILIYGISLVVKGEMTVGTLILFNTYEGMLIWPVRQMGRILSDLGKMQVSLGRVCEILDTPEEADSPDSQAFELNGDIVFSNVNFEYETDKPVLRDISFTVKKGETIAILGGTGSGKSTIMHLLLRLYDYKEGSIKINGHELSAIKKKWLREKVGIVLQEPFLFSKTIKENIRMARANATDEEISEAAKTACVHDVIEEFEKGYETIVGEKGVTLSGGQKQRVAIARTLIKNCDILIFDDSLSAVDTETDQKIRAALKSRQSKATTFIISQRITTLMQADRIFVIENATIADSGTHTELIARPGLYKRIWDIQSMLETDMEADLNGSI